MKIVIGIILSTLLIVTVIFAMKASSQGDVLVGLENRAANLTAANEELKTGLVMSTSLSEISKEAVTMGMTQPGKFIYVAANGVAMRGPNQVASIQ